MAFKKRGYIRDTPVELVRDYKVFAIACEGGVREPQYFNVFQYLSPKVKVDVIEDFVSDSEMQQKHSNKSAPKWVLDRAMRYIEKEGLLDEDDLWFVIDTDRWSYVQLKELADYCQQYANWHIVISNPCFEVWLYFHKKANITDSKSSTCEQFKFEISTLEQGGYHPHKFIPYLQNAITNAKAVDATPTYFMPNPKETKAYQLGEAILNQVGVNDFNHFIASKLPQLIQIEKEKAKKSQLRKK
jgi:hypothetical protein